MEDTCIVKLGGSIITDKKGGRPMLRLRRVKEIAREIARVRSKDPYLRLILLYGAGSFGHPLAHRYRLLDSPLSKRSLIGTGYTLSATRELGTGLSRAFLDAGIPVLPLQTSSFACVLDGRLRFTDISIVETIIENGGIPLLGGDVVFSDRQRTTIASADNIAVELARKFGKSRLFFATDVDGVYGKFPPSKHDRPFAMLDRTAVRDLLKTQFLKTTRTDVTGAMPGKLRALLDARGTTATIFNGDKRGAVSDALLGKKLGTSITL